MEVDDDGTTITAFSSALMVFENELEDIITEYDGIPQE